LLGKASDAAINQALILPNYIGYTPLHWASYKQDSAAFQALLGKASDAAINQALTIKYSDGNTPLHLVAEKQDSAAFQALVRKASPLSIRQALFIRHHVPRTLSWINAQIRQTMTLTELEPWILLLLKLSGEKEIDWLSSNKSAAYLKALLDKVIQNPDLFCQKIAVFIAKRMFALPQIAVTAINKITTTINETTSITLCNGATILLTDPDLFESIKTHGLNSWDDFYTLRQYSNLNPKNALLQGLLQFINNYNTIKFGTYNVHMQNINNELFSGNLLMKMFTGWQPAAWKEFIK
jgi:ankyrin repeat protein